MKQKHHILFISIKNLSLNGPKLQGLLLAGPYFLYTLQENGICMYVFAPFATAVCLELAESSCALVCLSRFSYAAELLLKKLHALQRKNS